MAYTISERKLRSYTPLLNAIIDSIRKGEEFSIRETQAWKVHEAIANAEAYADEHPRYKGLRDAVKVRQDGLEIRIVPSVTPHEFRLGEREEVEEIGRSLAESHPFTSALRQFEAGNSQSGNVQWPIWRDPEQDERAARAYANVLKLEIATLDYDESAGRAVAYVRRKGAPSMFDLLEGDR